MEVSVQTGCPRSTASNLLKFNIQLIARVAKVKFKIEHKISDWQETISLLQITELSISIHFMISDSIYLICCVISASFASHCFIWRIKFQSMCQISHFLLNC